MGATALRGRSDSNSIDQSYHGEKAWHVLQSAGGAGKSARRNTAKDETGVWIGYGWLPSMRDRDEGCRWFSAPPIFREHPRRQRPVLESRHSSHPLVDEKGRAGLSQGQ